MNKLSIDKINANSPYKVFESGSALFFETEQGIKYRIDFTEEFPMGGCESYQFMFSKLTLAHAPFDVQIRQTLVSVIKEFFRVNHNIMLYICDTSDRREASRSRLFAHWFQQFAEEEAYEFHSASATVEGEGFYAAIIVERDNPMLVSIVEDFNNTAKELTK